MILLTICLIFCADITLAQNKIWRMEEYPNPQVDPDACRRTEYSHPRICDPDGLIPQKDYLDTLDNMIKGMKQGAITCSGQVGYSVSIALMEGMERHGQTTNDAMIQRAREFAVYLARRSWNFTPAPCSNDVLILYSKDDKTLYIATGQKAREKLTDDIVHFIVTQHQSAFYNDVFEGLKAVLQDIKDTFGGISIGKPQERLPDPPNEGVVQEVRSAAVQPVVWTTLLISVICSQVAILL